MYYLPSHPADSESFWIDDQDGESLDPWSLPFVPAPEVESRPFDDEAALEGFPYGTQNDGLFRLASSLRAQGRDFDYGQVAMALAASRCTGKDGEPDPYPKEDSDGGPGWFSILERVYRDYEDGAETAAKEAREVMDLFTDESQFYELSKVRNLPKIDWVIQKIIPAGFITTLIGQGGVGKSYLAIYIAMCLALGKEFFGYQVKKTNVLFIDSELSLAVQVQRAKQVAQGKTFELADIPDGIHYLKLNSKFNQEFVDEIKEYIKENNIGLTILDSMTIAMADADALAAKDVNTFMDKIQQFGTVLALDHMQKMQPQQGFDKNLLSQFGSVFKRNKSRSSLKLGSNNGNIVVKHDKHNFTANEIPTFEYKMFSEEQDNIPDDEWPITFALTELPPELMKIKVSLRNGQMTTEQIGNTLAISPEQTLLILDDGKQRGIIRLVGTGIWELVPEVTSPEDQMFMDYIKELGRPVSYYELSKRFNQNKDQIRMKIRRGALRNGNLFLLESGRESRIWLEPTFAGAMPVLSDTPYQDEDD